MTDISELKTLLDTCDATIQMELTGNMPTYKFARLEYSHNLLYNSSLHRKIDEYHLTLHFDTAANLTTFFNKIVANLIKFNDRTAIAGYTRPPAFTHCDLDRSISSVNIDNIAEEVWALTVTRSI